MAETFIGHTAWWLRERATAQCVVAFFLSIFWAPALFPQTRHTTASFVFCTAVVTGQLIIAALAYRNFRRSKIQAVIDRLEGKL